MPKQYEKLTEKLKQLQQQLNQQGGKEQAKAATQKITPELQKIASNPPTDDSEKRQLLSQLNAIKNMPGIDPSFKDAANQAATSLQQHKAR